MVATKSEDVTKQGFCKMLWRKLRLRFGRVLIISYWSLCGREWGGGGRLFEAGRLFTFSAFRMSAYLRLDAYSNKYGIVVKVDLSNMCLTRLIWTKLEKQEEAVLTMSS